MKVRRLAALTALTLLSGLALACGGSTADGPVASPRSTVSAADTATPGLQADTTSVAPPATTHTETIDVHAIPLGDGKISSEPKQGNVFSCQTDFRAGAEHAGDWIEGDTWDATKKISVLGSVSWPDAVFSDDLSGSERKLEGNGLPVASTTGIFPIQRRDPAYQLDPNPNAIEAYPVAVALPAEPQVAAEASCLPLGAIGYALNGVAIFSGLDDAGRDAVAHEVQDACDGHPQGAGEYHYHGPSDCMPFADENNALVGYALDGFGIYSPYDQNGREYTNADLDDCHGITSEVEWNGQRITMYHYVMTREYPYTLGCFRGTPVPAASRR